MIAPRTDYGAVIADPPWPYRNNGVNGAAVNHYPTMSIEKICALPVANWCAADAVLYLWATWPQVAHVGLLSERFEHSRKPDSVHELAEQHPGPYLELFARRSREGWDTWGNEIPATPNYISRREGQENTAKKPNNRQKGKLLI